QSRSTPCTVQRLWHPAHQSVDVPYNAVVLVRSGRVIHSDTQRKVQAKGDTVFVMTPAHPHPRSLSHTDTQTQADIHARECSFAHSVLSLTHPRFHLNPTSSRPAE